MTKSLSGFVLGVKKYSNGDTEIDFITDDEQELKFSYFSDSSKKGELPKEIVHTLAETVGRNIWAEISFDDKGIATSVKLEEAGIEEDNSEEN